MREYVVWRTQDNAIDWFVLREGRYERLLLDDSSLYKSEISPGLWLDVAAMLRGDLAAVLQKQANGFRTPQHQAFVAQLSAKNN